MEPKDYLALSKEAQTAYLRSLSEADRLAFVSAMDVYEQEQNGNVPAAITPPTDSLPINGVNPITPPASAIPPLPSRPENSKDGRATNKDGSYAPVAPLIDDDPRMTVEEKDAFLKGNVDKIKDRMTSLAGVTSAFVDMANMSNPGQIEIAPSAIAGGISGLAAGGPLGALLGTVTGAIKAGNQRTAFEEQEAKREKAKFTGLRVAPSVMEKGGMVADETLVEEAADIEIPVQEEEGEVMFFPDGKLVDSMATKKHKEMKGKETDIPTDIIPNGTMIFSDSPKRMINLKEIKDDIFNITKGHYSENGNTKGEVIRMGDVYGDKGEKTPAQLAKMVRKQTPIIEDPVEQIEIDTNKENLRRRAEMLLPIMQMQEGVYKKFEYEKPEKFETGGMVKKKVKKYETGGVVDPNAFVKMPKAERDAYLASLPTYEEREKFMQGVYNLGVANFTEMNANTPVVGQPAATANGPTAPIPMLPDARVVPSSPVATPEPPYIPPTSLGIKLPELDGKVWDKVDSMIGDQKAQNEADYASSKEAAENLYRSTRFKNLGSLMTGLMGDAMQNPEVTPVTLGTEHVNSMFPKVTESQIQSQINPVRNQQNRVLSMINNSGISGTEVGSAIASTQARLIDAESEVRNKALSVNQTQESKRLDRLKNIIDLNNASEVNAENSTRSNRNKLTADIGKITSESIKAGGDLKVALHENLEKLKAWRQQNKNAITESEFNALVKQEEQKLDRAYKQKTLDQMSALVSQFKIG